MTVHGATATEGTGLIGCSTPLARSYDLGLLDLDGVLYIGQEAVPGAPEALRVAREAGLRACFVTNNASRPAPVVADHLTRIGVPATAADVVTSAQVAGALLARRLPRAASVLVVGGEGLRVALTDQGLRPVGSVQERPQAVVQGFDPDLSWRDLAEGTHAVRSGLFWLATNLDLTVPTPFGPAPGNGALVGLVAQAAGRRPDAVAGKPGPGSFLEAAGRYGSTRPLVVGDRLDTDLEGARAAGQDGLLVLTGVSGAAQVLACPPQRRPTYLGADLGCLLHPHPEVTPQWFGPAGNGGVRARSRAACVVVEQGELRVEQPGDDPVDILRAAAQALWAWTDRAGAQAGQQAGRQCGEQPGEQAGAGTDPEPVLAAVRRLDPGTAWAR